MWYSNLVHAPKQTNGNQHWSSMKYSLIYNQSNVVNNGKHATCHQTAVRHEQSNVTVLDKMN